MVKSAAGSLGRRRCRVSDVEWEVIEGLWVHHRHCGRWCEGSGCVEDEPGQIRSRFHGECLLVVARGRRKAEAFVHSLFKGHCYAKLGWHLRDVPHTTIRRAYAHHLGHKQLATIGDTHILLIGNERRSAEAVYEGWRFQHLGGRHLFMQSKVSVLITFIPETPRTPENDAGDVYTFFPAHH